MSPYRLRQLGHRDLLEDTKGHGQGKGLDHCLGRRHGDPHRNPDRHPVQVVNLSEIFIDRAPKDPALAGQNAVLLYYSALNTGTLTHRGNDPVGDRFFVRSDDQVMGQQHLYGPDDADAPGNCRTAGKVEWKRGSVLTGCAVLTLPKDTELGGVAFFDGDRKKPRLRVLRYP